MTLNNFNEEAIRATGDLLVTVLSEFGIEGASIVDIHVGPSVTQYELSIKTGTKFVIKNKGFKAINANWRGDFVFTVVVQVPKKLTSEQRNLLEQLAKTMNEQPPVKKRGLFG